MRKFVSILLGLTVVVSLSVNAQSYYSAGSDPLMRWRSINTEHYEIIYPEGIDSLARVYAANMEAVRKDAILVPQKVDPKRTSVILHPFTLTGDDTQRSNAPVRLDVYTSPNMYDYMSEPWEYTNSIAKSRHLGHAYMLDRGFFRYARYVFGDNARMLGDMLFFNKFYWMGDENVAVTDLTHAGAGRNADFLKAYRTAFAENDLRNYDRWKLGSYEFYTPEPDGFGYLLEANYRYQKGDYFFSSKWADSYFKHPFKAWIAGSLSDESSAFKSKYFTEYWQSIGNILLDDFDARKPFTAESKIWPAENYSEYLRFTYDEDENAIYAVKSSLKEADKLVRIDLTRGTEKFLRYFSQETSDLNMVGDLLYWSETVHKGPWELSDYSEVFTYNVKTGVVRNLTKNTRYFSPAPADDGMVVAVSENTVEGMSYLTILSPDGKKEASFMAPDNGSIKELTWMGDVLYCLIVTSDGLGMYSMDDDGWKNVIAPQWQNMSCLNMNTLRLNGKMTDVLTFTSDVDGVSNIYAYVPEERTTYRLINSPYGVSCANADNDGNLLYSRYGRTGYSIARTSASYFDMKPVDMSAPYSFPMADKGSEQASNAYPKPDKDYIASYMDESRYPSEHYNKLAHLLHIHSWAPLYYEPANVWGKDKMNASLGFTVASQNKLGTVKGRFGYSFAKSPYSSKYRSGLHSGISFNGGIPRIDINAEVNTSEKVEFIHYKNEDGEITNGYRFVGGFPYYDIYARIYQPLTYSMLGWNAELLPYLTYHHNNNRAVDLIDGRTGTADYFQAGISGTMEAETAYSAIYPRWGLGVSLDYMAPAAFGNSAKLFTSQTALSLSAYLPGFAVNHGFQVSLEAVNQRWKGGRAVFSTESLINMPRGFVKVDPAEFNSRNYVKGAIDYAIPVYLGDYNLLGVLYFRRLQIIPFFDYAVSWQYSGGKKDFYSVGTDLLADINVLRIRQGVATGLRYAYNNGSPSMPASHTFQFLVKVNL